MNMTEPFENPQVRAALAAFQLLEDDGKRSFYWALQNPIKARLDELNVPPEFVPETTTVTTTTAGIDEFTELLHNLKGRSIMTGIPDLDEAVAGLERQTLSILAARPSMGKTTLAWQIARNVAAGGLNVLFYSLEVSTASLWAKAVCGAAGLRWRDIRLSGYKHSVSEDVITFLGHHANELKKAYNERLWVDANPHTTADLWQATETLRPDLIIVDHLRLLKDKNESEVKRQGEISMRLKEIAKAFNCHVMCAAQLNRGVEARGADDKRPTLADLRDSGEIEENADLVMMIYRDDYYKGSLPGVMKSDTEILIRKYRDDIGRQMVKLEFDLEHQWFKSPRVRA